MGYLYDDKDNAPMVEDNFPINVPNGCWNCREYDGDRCMKDWNNADPCYYIDWRDDKKPSDICEDHDLDPDIKPEEFDFGGNEP